MNTSFQLFGSVKRGSPFIGDVSHRLIHWRHTTRDIGGYWSATCDYQGTRSDLNEMFYHGLMREIRAARAGFPLWQGFLGAMSYLRNGVTWTQSVNGLANAVRVLYTRIGDNLLTDGSAESGPWTAVNSATVEQSTEWVTDGTYSCKITVGDTEIRGADIEPSLTIVAEAAYNVSLDVHVAGGSWRIAVNQTGDDSKVVAKSTKGKLGDIKIQLSIPVTNTYAGTVRFRVTSEASAGSIYCDNAIFQLAPEPATTNWKVDATALQEFGRIENVLNLNAMTAATANARALTALFDASWPITAPPDDEVGRGAVAQPDKLSLTFFGYIFTARWRYSRRYATDTMTNYVLDALALQSDYLQRGVVRNNITPFQADTSDPISAWKMLSEVATSGEENGTPWTLGVYTNRQLHYLPRDAATLYQFRGGEAYDHGGHHVPGYLARPGWAEFVDAPRGLGSTLNRDRTTTRVYIREIEYDGDTDRAKYHRTAEGE